MTSIRRRLLAGTALAVALAFLVSGVLVVVLSRSSLRAQFDEALVARANALAALVEEDEGQVVVELDPAGTPGEVQYFQLWQGERVLLRSTSLGGGDLARLPGTGAFADVVLPGGAAGRSVTLRVPARREPDEAGSAEPPPTVTLVLARPTESLSSAASRIAEVMIGAGAFGTLLCLAILIAVMRAALAPVRSLAAAIAELRASDLALKLEAGATPAELRPVVDRLEELLRRLAGAFARERELTAEVAHELRTPLAGLRATLEVVLSRDDRPPEKYREALASCLLITEQTQGVVEALLSLSRLDAGALATQRESVRVDDLVREVLAPLAGRAAERRVTVATALEPVTRVTDRAKLQLVVKNLLDNATTYVDDGGAIHVRLADNELAIRNTGCTLAPGDEDRVFERFWRGDAARSVPGHAGIGLALCRKLVELLGGAIRVEIAGSAFVVTVSL